ncbi:MAG: protein kinase [Planctomycetota bacterium]
MKLPDAPDPDVDSHLEEYCEEVADGRDPDAEKFCRERGRDSQLLRREIGRVQRLRLALRGLARGGARDAEDAIPSVLGEFRLLREIGRGGMGIVYEARQESLDRRVAVKVLPPFFSIRKESLERFHREASMASRLHHPGIVRIHSVGDDHGIHYFSMDLVRGPSLDAVIGGLRGWTVDTLDADRIRRTVEGLIQASGRPSAVVRGRAVVSSSGGSSIWGDTYIDVVSRIAAQVCDSLQHAHQAGVIHRDIKPSNILIQRDGNIVVTDFGLARQEGLPSITVTGEFAGTPHYVSPEQADSRTRDLDARTDLFSLGSTLYELLTLRRPFDGSTGHDVLGQVVEAEPVRPRKINRSIPRDLETICLTALEKAPGRRYGSAAAMGDDLRRFLSGEPVLARPLGLATRAFRWMRRRPALTATLALASCLVVGLPIIGGLYWKLQETRLASEKRDRGRLLTEFARSRLLVNPGQSLAVAVRSAEEHGLDPLTYRVLYDAVLRALEPGHEEVLLDWHLDAVLGTVFAPDGSLLATCGEDGRAALWTVPDLKQRKLLRGHGTQVIFIAFSPEGRYVATSCLDGKVRLYETAGADETPVAVFDGFSGWPGRGHGGSFLAFSPDGQRLAIARGFPHQVDIHDLASTDPPVSVDLEDMTLSVRFTPDEVGVVTTSRSGGLQVWDSRSGELLQSLPLFEGSKVFDAPSGGKFIAGVSPIGGAQIFAWNGRRFDPRHVGEFSGERVNDAEFSPDEKYFAVGVNDGSTHLLILEDGREAAEICLDEQPASVLAVEFSDSSDLLATGSADGVIRIYGLGSIPMASGEPDLVLRGHEAAVRTLDLAPDGRWLASGSADGTVRLWDLHADESLVMSCGKGPVTDFALLPDQEKLVAVHEDGSAQVWSWMRGEAVAAMPGDEDGLYRVSVSADGAQMLLVREPTDHGSGLVRLLARDLLREIARWAGVKAAFSPDGQWIVTGASTGELSFRDVGLRRLIQPEQSHGSLIMSLAFSLDRPLLLATSADTTASIWDWRTGELLRILSGQKFPVDAGDINVEGTMAVIGGSDDVAWIWHLVDGSEPIVLRGHGAQVAVVRISHGGHTVATGAKDGGVFLWDLETGELLRALAGPGEQNPSAVLSLAFSPDDQFVLVCFADGGVQLVEAGTGRLLADLQGHTDSVVRGEFSFGGDWILTGSRDGTIRRWPVNPLDLARDRARARTAREMRDILPGVASGVLDLESPGQAAVPVAAADAIDPYRLSNAAWVVVQFDAVHGDAYEFALQWALQAVRERPAIADYWTTLGAAYYRLEEFEAALECLLKARDLERKSEKPGGPSNPAFLAMTLFRLKVGEEQVEANLDLYCGMVAREEYSEVWELRLLLQEVEETLGS